MSTSYSCDYYLHEDHTPLLPGSRGMYQTLLLYDNVGHLLLLHGGLTQYIYHSSIVLYISRLSNVLPYPHLNSLPGLLAILDTPISYPYNCYLHTYHIPPLLGHWGRIIDVLLRHVGLTPQTCHTSNCPLYQQAVQCCSLSAL